VENLFGSAFATVGAADARLATRSATRFNPRFRLVDGASEAPMRLANAERRYRHQTPTSDRAVRSRRQIATSDRGECRLRAFHLSRANRTA
jgi:hypothetical protein